MLIDMFRLFIAIIMPWLSLLLDDNPTGAMLALVMQATIVGWPFASMWAIKVEKERKLKKHVKDHD